MSDQYQGATNQYIPELDLVLLFIDVAEKAFAANDFCRDAFGISHYFGLSFQRTVGSIYCHS